MKRPVLALALAAIGLAATPAPAAADLTFFLGVNRTPEARTTRGFGVGINLLIVGFEFEHASTREDVEGTVPAPSLTTSMFNALVMTPTSGVQLYATAGGGFYRERLVDERETSFGTNIGGGVKMTLVGPLRLRLDYRVFNLRGNALYKNPHRFYAGANISF